MFMCIDEREKATQKMLIEFTGLSEENKQKFIDRLNSLKNGDSVVNPQNPCQTNL